MTSPKKNGPTGHVNKESTTQWVQRTFAGNNVTINTFCQEVLSQETHIIAELGKQAGPVHLGEGKLWCDQEEEHSEE